MSSEKVIQESDVMSVDQVRNPFEVSGVPKWFWAIGFWLGILGCWLLSGVSDLGTFDHLMLWPLHALVFAVFLTLFYQLFLVLADDRAKGSEERFGILCEHFLPEYSDVANPDQVELCSKQLQLEATSAHDRRFVLMAIVALPVSVVAYLIFLCGLYGERPSYAIETSELVKSLVVPLIECMLLVMFVAVTSLFTKKTMVNHAKELSMEIARRYRSGDLARRASPAVSPPMHELTPPEGAVEKSPSGMPVATPGLSDSDDDLPPTVLGNPGGGSSQASNDTGKRSRRRRGGV